MKKRWIPIFVWAMAIHSLTVIIATGHFEFAGPPAFLLVTSSLLIFEWWLDFYRDIKSKQETRRANACHMLDRIRRHQMDERWMEEIRGRQ